MALIRLHKSTGSTTIFTKIQLNLISSNTEGSFTMANSFLGPWEILMTAQENKY